LQEEAERDRAVAQAALEFLAQKVRAALTRIVRREPGLPSLGNPVIAAESAGAIRTGEFESVLPVIAALTVAGGTGFFMRRSMNAAVAG
jgi:hypothetical protein